MSSEYVIRKMGYAVAAAAILSVLAMPLIPQGNCLTDYEITVDEGDIFVIEIEEVLSPFYEWILTHYDPEYLEFLGESYRPPEDGLLGITIKVFEFRALKPGITKIVFTDYELDINGETVKELEFRDYEVRVVPWLGPIPSEIACNGAIYVKTWGILPQGIKVMEFAEVDGVTVYAIEGIVHRTPPQLFIQNMIWEYIIYVREDMVGQEIISEQEAVEISRETEAVKFLLLVEDDAYCEAIYSESDEGRCWKVSWWTPKNFGYPWIEVIVDAHTGAVVDVSFLKAIS